MKSILAWISILLLAKGVIIPEYLAIVAQGPVKIQITSFSINGLYNLIQQYPFDNDLIEGIEEIYEISSGKQTQWIYSSPWHVTCLYIGSDMSQLETPAYLNFEEGKKAQLFSPLFVFVPNKLMIAAILINRNQFIIENHYPHITLFQNWPAVNSNFVLEALFDESGPLYSYYPKQILHDPFFQIEQVFRNIMVLEEYVDIYVSRKFTNNLDLVGITQKMYYLDKTI